MIVDPRGTQMDQTPMAFPLLFEVNHRAIIAGANTDMKLIPAPSINRLASMMPMPLLRAPMPEPTIRQKRAINPTAR